MREGWKYKKLGEVCTFITDGSHNPPKGIAHSRYRMISSQNIFDDELKITNDTVRFLSKDDYINENKRTRLTKGVVLLTIVGTIGRCCVLNGEEGNLTLQRSVAVLHPCSEIISRFLMHCLIGNRSKLDKEAHGIAQRGIYLKQLSSLEIPLPPLSEQQAIVAELDKINQLIALKKSQLANLDLIAQSIFYEMFGDPVENEKGWEVKKLGEVIQEYSVRNKTRENIPVYSVTNSQGFCKDYFSKDVASEDKTSYKIVPYGYFAYNPSRINVGSIDWQHKEDKVIVSPLYNVFSLSESVLQQYLLYFLKSPATIKYIDTIAIGSVRLNLKLSMLKDFSLPLPPLPLQQTFAERVEVIEKQKEIISAMIKDLETLLASRMQYWFD
ncbi:MAG: restriction endonuclease subunit S [Bacteroidaceae bacterium]|nr:restriction endonuclease subunit S [Bacteroidaceae bacterium]